MSATGVNHVNVSVEDLGEAVEFYESVLGMEPIPSIESSAPGAWFQVGDAQLHLTERGGPGPEVHHFAVDVDDFAAVYERARDRGALDADTFGAALYEFPDGAAQLYLRDPSGNLVECDWPDATTLPTALRERLATRAERFGVEQTGETTIYPNRE
ncbi:MAG: VOC family protein [Haloferacaceae archaeon]